MSVPVRIAPVLGILLLAACTNPYDPGQRAAGGALIGAGTGAAIGGIAGGPRGLAIGALAGGLGGAAIGAVTTPTPPQYQAGYAPQGYGQPVYNAPQPVPAPAPTGAYTYYPNYPAPAPAYAAPPYPQPQPAPPPQPMPQGSYWQPDPYGYHY